MAGVKLPKLGTIQDYILQEFSVKELQREILKEKLNAFASIAAAGGNKEWANKVIGTWNEYVELSYGLPSSERARQVTDELLKEEYNKFKELRPIMTVGKDGTLIVKGLDKFKNS